MLPSNAPDIPHDLAYMPHPGYTVHALGLAFAILVDSKADVGIREADLLESQVRMHRLEFAVQVFDGLWFHGLRSAQNVQGKGQPREV